MQGTYNLWMVYLSIFVAVFVSYTALNNAKARPARNPSKFIVQADDGWMPDRAA